MRAYVQVFMNIKRYAQSFNEFFVLSPSFNVFPRQILLNVSLSQHNTEPTVCLENDSSRPNLILAAGLNHFSSSELHPTQSKCNLC